MFSGDSFKSFAIDGSDVFRIVESSICMKIAVARIMGRNFLTDGFGVLMDSDIKQK